MNYQLIAHRGFSAIAPENTLVAMTTAIEYGAIGIEFDLQLSLDAVPVVIHDSNLERTTNGSGKVQDYTLAQLKKFDAGSWFSPQFQGETIPSLTEVLDLLKNTNLTIYPELKHPSRWTSQALDNLIQILGENLWQNRCVILCFETQLLSQIRAKTKDLSIGYNCGIITEFKPKLAQAQQQGQAMIMSEYHLLLEHPQLIQICRQQNIEVGAWTVDNPNDLEKLVNLGIEKIITNRLKLLYI